MRFLLPGLILFLLSACLDEPDCITTATNIVKISLKETDVDSAASVLFLKISISGTDTLLYVGQQAPFLNLPLNPAADETTFRFYYGTSIDSLTLVYSRRTSLVSPDCGAFVYFEKVAAKSYSFSDVEIINPQLSTSATNNINIKL